MPSISDYPVAAAVAPTDILVGNVGGVTSQIPISTLPTGGGGGGQYVAIPPAAAGSSGTAGEYSFDTNYAYFCIATNTWKRVALISMPLTIALTYVSDGDANGVFTFLGKGKDVGGVWTNPVTAGRLTITPSAAMGLGTTAGLVDHATNDQWIGPAANSFFNFDLGAGSLLVCDKWSLRARTGGTTAAVDCNLWGSNDGTTWTSVSPQTSATVPQTSNTWGSFTVVHDTAYRYWRIQQTTNTHFTIGELELYGTLTYSP